MAFFDIEEVKQRAKGHWKSIVLQLCPGVTEAMLSGGQTGCPKCSDGKPGDRFYVFRDFNETGGFICNQCRRDHNRDGLFFLRWFHDWDFPTAVEAVAKIVGVKGKGNDKKKSREPVDAVAYESEKHKDVNPFESYKSLQLSPAEIRQAVEQWAATKTGVDVDAVMASRPDVGLWPVTSRSPQKCIRFIGHGNPLFGPKPRSYGPAACHLYRADGKKFRAFGGGGERKNHNAKGSANSWVVVGGLDRFEAASVVWKVEGLPDAFALLPLLPPHHSIVTMTNGAGWRSGSDRMPPMSIFRGKTVIVSADADEPGQAGGNAFAADVRRHCVRCLIFTLPYAVKMRDGEDLRDWICEKKRSLADIASHLKTWEFLQASQVELFGSARSFRKRTFLAEDMTDVANADHFAANSQYTLRYIHAWNKWYYWDSRRWRVDDIGRALSASKKVAAEVFDDARQTNSYHALKFAQKTSNGSGLANMQANSIDLLSVAVDDLDSDKWIFNCQNGSIDLRTGELMRHRQEDYSTKISPSYYDETADCPRWNQFLAEVFEGVEDIIPFLARFFGYCLSGQIKEQQFPIFWGGGSNGKSTLMNTILDVVGRDYGMQQNADLIVRRKQEPHPTELAAMFGKRLVIMSETEENQRLAESKVKLLTGGEPIPCRRMHEDWWSYVPEFKMVVVTNAKPQVWGQDYAIWRRLMFVPFQQCFEGERKDPDLIEKLAEEQPGILAWMVRGCLEWQQVGLSPPESVVSATADYQREQDVVGRFAADCLIFAPNCKSSSKAIKVCFDAWQQEGDEPPLSQKKIAKWLSDNNCEKYRSNGVWWRGVGVVADRSGRDQLSGVGGVDDDPYFTNL